MMKKLLTILLTLLPLLTWGQGTTGDEPNAEPYAVLSENNTVLTFYYDDKKDALSGMDVGPFSGYPKYQTWSDQCESITSVVFDASFADCTSITSTRYWFYKCSNLTTITGLNHLNTANVMDMSYMFYNCSSLTSLDVSGFNTANVTNMGGMFYGCSSLTSLDVSGFNTANVTTMSSMFYSCSSLTSLNVSGFNTANVTTMSSMFYNCSNLTGIDLSSFKTDKVTSMGEMFRDCKKLITVFAGSDWSTVAVTSSNGMFTNCTNLLGGNGTIYNWTHTDYTYAHIDGGLANPGYFTESGAVPYVYTSEPYAVLSDNNTKITFYYDDQKTARGGLSVGPFSYHTVDDNTISWFEYRDSIKNVVFDNSFANCLTLTSTACWFFECRNLTTITGIENLKTDNVATMSQMFYRCRSLTNLDLSGFNTTSVWSMYYMFGECMELTSLNISNFNTENVTDMCSMFSSCRKLTTLDVSSFNTSNVTRMESMFCGCKSLTALDVTGFNTEKVTNMTQMFMGCDAMKRLDLSSFNTANVREMYLMFYSNPNLKTIYVGNDWSTASVTEGDYMFTECPALIGGAGTIYDENHVDYTYAHIDGGTENPGYFTEKADTVVVMDSEPYAVLSDNNTVLTFYYDEKKAERNGMDLGEYYLSTVNEENLWVVGGRAWNDYYKTITNVVFDPSFANCESITSTSCWFCSMVNLESVSGFDYLNTSNVIDMSHMFRDCSNLRSLDVSHFKTDKVTNMWYMFQNCSSLQRLDVSGFNTENVTNLGGLFSNCSSLASVDVSGFKTGNATDMSQMFEGCYSLTSLDLSGFNTENVTRMDDMFFNCENLRSLDLSNFNTANVTTMFRMFYGCSALENLDVSNFNTEKVSSVLAMFMHCSNLTSLDLSSFSLSEITTMERMFCNVSKVEVLDLSGFKTGKVENMWEVFSGCSNLKTIYVGNDWSTASVTNGTSMFANCMSLVGGAGTVYDASHTDYTYAHIDGGTSNPGYFTRSGDEPYVAPTDTVATPTFSWEGDILTISCATEGATILYSAQTADENGVYGADAFALYERPFEYRSDALLKARATKDGMEDSDILTLEYPYTAWQQLKKAIEYSVTTVMMCVDNQKVRQEDVMQLKYMAEEAETYYNERQLKRNEIERMAGDLMARSGELRYQLEAAEYVYDAGNGVLTISVGTTVAEALEAAGGRDKIAESLTAIIWNNTTPLPNSDLQGLNNPNMLIYVADASLAPANRDNVIVGNDSTGYTAKNIVLTDVSEGNGNFYCPREFKAEMISYTHEYRQTTETGVARGWETIALPFTVQTIMHEKNGLIAPFGTDASDRHFWLRQLSERGLARATVIEANLPYLISMPNSNEYPAEYNQAGRVTFSAQDTFVPETETYGMEMHSENGEMIMFLPCFQSQSADEQVYALNVGEQRGSYAEGSVFVANYRAVRPFEAFTVHHGNGPAPLYIPIFDMSNGTTGVEDVRSKMEDERGSIWYDLHGRKLQQKPSRKGVYILNGKKIIR